MKNSYLALALSAAFALATPLEPEAVQAGKYYNIQTKSEINSLRNQFLSQRGNRVGLYPGAKESASAAAKVLATSYDAASTLAFSIGDPSNQIALAGSNGLLEMVVVKNPTGDSIPRGQAMEWSTFVIDSSGNVNVNDGQNIPTRRWVVFDSGDGGLGIGLYDGVTLPQTRPFQNISMVAIQAGQPSGPGMAMSRPSPSGDRPPVQQAPKPALSQPTKAQPTPTNKPSGSPGWGWGAFGTPRPKPEESDDD